MIDYGISVATEAVYEIKRLDTDRFEEELLTGLVHLLHDLHQHREHCGLQWIV